MDHITNVLILMIFSLILLITGIIIILNNEGLIELLGLILIILGTIGTWKYYKDYSSIEEPPPQLWGSSDVLAQLQGTQSSYTPMTEREFKRARVQLGLSRSELFD